jgi:hypothetical protein
VRSRAVGSRTGFLGGEVVLVSASRADPDALLPLAIAKTAPPQPLPAGVDRRRLFNLLDAAARSRSIASWA